MTTKMIAPQDSGGAQCDGVDYPVTDGYITVENGEHVAKLEAHGFVVVPGEVSSDAPPPAPEPVGTPDFSKMSRDGIVNWLAANGAPDHKPSEAKGDLVAAAEARFAELVEALKNPPVVEPVEGEGSGEGDKKDGEGEQ